MQIVSKLSCSLPFDMRVTSSRSSISRASSSTLRRTTSSASLTGSESGISASSSPTMAITGASGLRSSRQEGQDLVLGGICANQLLTQCDVARLVFYQIKDALDG